jgi:hypothetical protein
VAPCGGADSLFLAVGGADGTWTGAEDGAGDAGAKRASSNASGSWWSGPAPRGP